MEITLYRIKCDFYLKLIDSYDFRAFGQLISPTLINCSIDWNYLMNILASRLKKLFRIDLINKQSGRINLD